MRVLQMSNKDFEEQTVLETLRKTYEQLKFPAKSGIERRSYTRYKAELLVQFKDKQADVRALTVDIGGGGLRFVYKSPLDQEQEYEFKIFLDLLDTPIAAGGRVVWQKLIPEEEKYEIGIFFSNISDKDRVILQNILAEHYNPALPPGSERRQFLRVPKLLFATVEMEEGGNKEIFSGLIVDISMGGVRLLSARQVPNGATLHLNVELEEQSVLKLNGKVVWGNRVEALKKFQHGVEFIYGVEFASTSSTVKSIIDEYLDFRRNEEETDLVKTLLRLGKEGKLPIE